MTSIDKKTIEHVALLSRLELRQEEKELFASQLQDILTYIEKLNEMDTSQVKPMAYATIRTNVFREDAPTPSLNTEEALKNAPGKVVDFFKVPKVIE